MMKMDGVATRAEDARILPPVLHSSSEEEEELLLSGRRRGRRPINATGNPLEADENASADEDEDGDEDEDEMIIIHGDAAAAAEVVLGGAAQPSTTLVGDGGAASATRGILRRQGGSSSLAPPTPPPPPPPQVLRADDDGMKKMTSLEQHIISTSDYSDRQRLLYHITYLSTQLQRAQLQIQHMERVMVVAKTKLVSEPPTMDDASSASNHNNSTNKKNHDDVEDPLHDENDHGTVVLRLSANSAAAALLAAQTEEEMHQRLLTTAERFDPLLAQDHINRLDDALAQVGLLREVELQRLQQAEAELTNLRHERNEAVEQVDVLQRRLEELQHAHHQQGEAYATSRHEVERLRREELKLNRQLVGLRELHGDGDGGRILLSSALPPTGTQQQHQHHHHRRTDYDGEVVALVEAEAVARQSICQEQFWQPMIIAFDAGLTWLTDLQQLHATRTVMEAQMMLAGQAQQQARQQHHPSGGLVSLNDDDVAAVVDPAPSDADLLLLTHQQSELQQLRGRLHIMNERLRMGRVEAERMRFLLDGEQRRSEMLAAEHSTQLKRAYEELLQERQIVMDCLQREMQARVEEAFADGRRFERERHHQRHRVEATSSSSHAEEVQPAASHRGASRDQRHAGTRKGGLR